MSVAPRFDILIVEDNPGDVVLVREHLEQTGLAFLLHVVRDGAAALEFVRRRGGYPNAPRPDLMLLDLNLPKLSGLEVLAEVKDDASIRSIPVVVLTSSRSEQDAERAYEALATAFVRKPRSLEKWEAFARAVKEFFFEVAELPSRSGL
ncbi:MAG: response regulator [Myxococcota bacterium]